MGIHLNGVGDGTWRHGEKSMQGSGGGWKEGREGGKTPTLGRSCRHAEIGRS